MIPICMCYGYPPVHPLTTNTFEHDLTLFSNFSFLFLFSLLIILFFSSSSFSSSSSLPFLSSCTDYSWEFRFQTFYEAPKPSLVASPTSELLLLTTMMINNTAHDLVDHKHISPKYLCCSSYIIQTQ